MQTSRHSISISFSGTNCKECGEPACLAFAVKLAGQEAGILKCSLLFSDKYQKKRKVLFELLHAAGYDVPSVSSTTEKRLEG